MNIQKNSFKYSSDLTVVGIILLGVTLRLLLPIRGFNYDIESWKIAADIMAHDGNVYGETGRYNYGPIWFYILHFVNQSFGGFGELVAFRWKVAVFLTGVDIAIFWFLLRTYGVWIAALFFLNPISIIITGYHSQLDSLAVLIALSAAAIIHKWKSPLGLGAGLIVLGLSLSTKHILFFFPIWLAIKQKTWIARLLALGLPYALFLLLFVPFWQDGSDGIMKNVFLYRSYNNAPFWHVFTPEFLYTSVPPVLLFFSSLLILGFYWRKETVLNSLNYYLITVVIFSSAVANQYLVIPTPAIATQWNWGYGLYSAFSTIFLSVDWAGLHLGTLQRALSWQGKNGYLIAIPLLFLGLVIHMFRQRLALKSQSQPEGISKPVLKD